MQHAIKACLFPPGVSWFCAKLFFLFSTAKKKPICKHSFLSTLFFFASSKQKRWPYPLQVLTKRNHFPSFFLFPPCSQQPSQRTALRGFESRSEGEEGEEGEETIEGCSLILLSLLRKRVFSFSSEGGDSAQDKKREMKDA